MRTLRCLLFSLVLVLLCAQAKAEPYEVTRYVKIDLRNLRTACMFNEKFEPFPCDFEVGAGRTSRELLPTDRSVWLLGSRIDVVRVTDGQVEVKSEDPRYAKLNHHVLVAYAEGIKYTSGFPAQVPLAAGSEFTDASLPRPYGYEMRTGYWAVGDWHWHNVAQPPVPEEEEVYLRFINTYDDVCADCIDTQSVWFDSNPSQGAEFCVPPNQKAEEFIYDGVEWAIAQRYRVVAAMAHTHDHGSRLEMVHNGEVVADFVPEMGADASYHISHTAGCGNTFWHAHDGHLRVKTIPVWTPGAEGPELQPGDRVWARSYYDNPHAREIDGMGILVTFLEVLK